MNEGFLIVLVGGGLRYMKLTGGGGEQYFEPENDVPYRICSVSIARSLTKLLYWVIPEVITFFLLAILFTWNQLIGQLHYAKLSWTINIDR